MSIDLKAIKITDSVYWVGAIDWNVRNFHGYKTHKGTTYNAYLIIADKITLIDTVKKGFENELLSRISSVINPEKINYIISNHAEPDHSGSLLHIIDRVKPEKIFASKMGVKALKMHYSFNQELTAVENVSTLDLGGKKVTFIETRMLHWPDSMFTYLNDDKILFSQDAFGLHLASSERFDDELSWHLLKSQSASYYANIITLYSPHVIKLLKEVEELKLEFNYIAPDHGPIWRNKENFNKIFKLYKKWANRELDPHVVIVYDTMWHSTEKMARFIEDSIREEGIIVDSMCLSINDRSDVADKMLNASAIIVGSPTLNNNLLPSIADILTYLKGLKFKTPFAAAFGSYGWSGEAINQIKEYLNQMETELIGEVKSKYVPDENILKDCYELGKRIAEKVKTITS